MDYYNKSRQKLKRAMIALLPFVIYVIWQARNQRMDPPTWITIIGGIAWIYSYIISFSGFINGIQSYRHKEPYNHKRAWVMIGNFCFFGIFSLMILLNMIDAIRFFNK